MSNLIIRRAERKQAKLRIGMFGPSGSGKTYSALKVAHGLCGDWKKILVIDTENNSADLYSHLGEYNVLQLNAPYTPEKYIEAIDAGEKAGMEVIIIDSITHEWAGQGGILEIADAMSKDSKSSFAAWAKLTPRHNKFIDAILTAQAHMICCGRSKQDYAINQTEKNGKTVNVPEKIGLKSITREGFDYEMTTSFDLTITHLAVSTKDRTGIFQDKPEEVLTEESGKKLAAWNQSGSVVADDHSKVKHRIKELIDSMVEVAEGEKLTGDDYKKFVKELTDLDLNPENFAEIVSRLEVKATELAPVSDEVEEEVQIGDENAPEQQEEVQEETPEVKEEKPVKKSTQSKLTKQLKK